MLKTDYKMLKQILLITKDPKKSLAISNDSTQILLVKDLRNVIDQKAIKHVKPQFVLPAVERLIDAGFLRYKDRYFGGFTFSITDLALLRKEIFWESFTKKFWYGFASGVLTGVTVSVLGHLIIKGLSAMGL